MSCKSCTKSFSLLRKEKGCPACGFSFCSTCLSHKVFVPKLNAEAKVCMKCKVSNKEESKDAVFVPPDAYLKRLEKIENRLPTTVGACQPNDDQFRNFRKGLSTEDQKILDRLEQLKKDRTEAPPAKPTDLQIMERLRRLRGLDDATSTSGSNSSQSAKASLPAKDLRSDQEKTEDLIRQYLDEAKIDNSNKEAFDDRIDEINHRLQILKGTSSEKKNLAERSEDTSESDNEEETIKKIIEKYKAEALLEQELVTEETDQNSELPWCEICNEDAKMRCLGCKYLFCKVCFQEHKDDDLGCNEYVPYHKK